MNQFRMSPSGNGYFFFFCCFIKWDKSPSSQNSIIIISCPSSMKFSSYPTMWGCFSVFKSSDLFYFYRIKGLSNYLEHGLLLLFFLHVIDYNLFSDKDLHLLAFFANPVD